MPSNYQAALITPSALINEKAIYTRGCAALENLGVHVHSGVFQRRLPDTQAKVAELHAAYQDPAIHLILAQRGGSGAMKLLPFLDWDVIRSQPKVLAGFSDVTALLNVIHERTGQVTWHAPMLRYLGDNHPVMRRSFQNAVKGFPRANLLAGSRVHLLQPGSGEGVLKGGNLATLTALIGTPYDLDTRGAVLFLEDIGELPHRLDRMLTQWIMAGKFAQVRAVILGDFSGVPATKVWAFIRGQIPRTIPVLRCSAIGHVPSCLTLPIGAQAACHCSGRAVSLNLIKSKG